MSEMAINKYEGIKYQWLLISIKYISSINKYQDLSADNHMIVK